MSKRGFRSTVLSDLGLYDKNMNVLSYGWDSQKQYDRVWNTIVDVDRVKEIYERHYNNFTYDNCEWNGSKYIPKKDWKTRNYSGTLTKEFDEKKGINNFEQRVNNIGSRRVPNFNWIFYGTFTQHFNPFKQGSFDLLDRNRIGCFDFVYVFPTHQVQRRLKNKETKLFDEKWEDIEVNTNIEMLKYYSNDEFRELVGHKRFNFYKKQFLHERSKYHFGGWSNPVLYDVNPSSHNGIYSKPVKFLCLKSDKTNTSSVSLDISCIVPTLMINNIMNEVRKGNKKNKVIRKKIRLKVS